MSRIIIGGVPIMPYSADLMAGTPRMTVSKEFALVQSPELVAKTQAWMTKFFGLSYPVVHAHAGTNQETVYVHPDHFQALLDSMDAIIAMEPNPQTDFINRMMMKGRQP